MDLPVVGNIPPDAVEMKDEDGSGGGGGGGGVATLHVPGVWENSPLSTLLWKLSKNNDNDDDKVLEKKMKLQIINIITNKKNTEDIELITNFSCYLIMH